MTKSGVKSQCDLFASLFFAILFHHRAFVRHHRLQDFSLPFIIGNRPSTFFLGVVMGKANQGPENTQKQGSGHFLWLFMGFNVLMGLIIIYMIFFSK